ncbi:MAG: hypothetical protein M3Z96_04400 [Pseudomonadota bacterium]|nr:hypothetical protein [Pseudomonadota bacterium]
MNLARGSSRRAGIAGRSQVKPGKNCRNGRANRPACRRTRRALDRPEADVAAELARGRDTGEIAGLRRVSPGTLRAQLRSIFAKTGTCRQSELVALVLCYSRVPRQSLG